MQVGDLVERSWPSDPGRVGVVVRPATGTDYVVVQWTDGPRDSVRAMFLKVVNASR